MPGDDDVIDWLAGLERAATPGPWQIEREELSVDFDDEDQEQAYPERVGPICIDHVSCDVPTVEADARLIAALRSVAPQAIAVVRAAVGVLTDARYALAVAAGGPQIGMPRMPVSTATRIERELGEPVDALRARLREVRDAG